MRRNTIIALFLLLTAITISGVIAVVRFWNLT